MKFDDIKTPSNLKACVENGTDSHFFTRKTMSFFGDTMRNFGLIKHKCERGLIIELYRKQPVANGLQSSHYFKQSSADPELAVRVFDRELKAYGVEQ
jgi:hypothetical protein